MDSSSDSEFSGFSGTVSEYDCHIAAEEFDAECKIKEIQTGTLSDFSNISDSDTGDGFSETDDLPLNVLASLQKCDDLPIVSEDSSSEIDDSDLDPDYVQPLKKHKPKRKPKNQSLEYAMKVSRNDARKLNKMKLDHYKEIKRVLDENELELVPVPPDGNCFFSATLLQLKDHTVDDVRKLRQMICDHMENYKDEYIEFTTCTSEEFGKEISHLRHDSTWDSSLSDLFPMAAANLFNRPAIIFSSRKGKEVDYVSTDMDPSESDKEPLKYCFLALPGMEHYDYCVKKAGEHNFSLYI